MLLGRKAITFICYGLSPVLSKPKVPECGFGVAAAGGGGDPPRRPDGSDLGPKGHRAVGDYLVLGDSDDEEQQLPEAQEYPCAGCIKTLINTGVLPVCVRGARGKSCTHCRVRHTPCR